MSDNAPRLEIRLAGAAFIPLNWDGNTVLDETILITRNTHTPFLYAPMGAGVLPCTPAWPESCCVVVDREGECYTAIRLDAVTTIRIENLKESILPCLADLPHVPDVTKWLPSEPKSGAAPIRLLVKQGLLDEVRLAPDWAESEPAGEFPLQPVCAEVSWHAGTLSDEKRVFDVILTRDGKDYTLSINPSLYGPAKPITLFLTSLCGWTGATDGADLVDFDGVKELFDAKLPKVRFRGAVKQPKSGGCPTVKARFTSR